MTSGSHPFVTGATGFVGSHFVLRLLQAGARVTALARGSSAAHARSRLCAAVEAAADAYTDPGPLRPSVPFGSLDVVLGDITRSRCGVGQAELASLRGHVDELWHLAACLKYEDEHRDEIIQHNVDGTAHALELARALGVRRFVYFSTAYTSGSREGLIAEAPVPADTQHNNYYESSKATAERLVAQECQAAAIEWQILRPSIVVGPAATHRTGGSSTGFYGFIREVRRLRSTLASDDRTITIRGDAATPLNLVPVDVVVADMLAARSGSHRSKAHHHLTCPAPLPVGEVIRCICETLGLRPFRMVPDHQPTSRLERVIDQRLDFYRSYFRAAKSFERTLPNPPTLTLADIAAFTREALAEPGAAAARREAADPRPARVDPCGPAVP
jgi:nucleoside-diphosphate-sugar epimerase